MLSPSHQKILRCNKMGQPEAWITHEECATYYAAKKVLWEAGETFIDIVGGWQNGQRSRLAMNSIIGVAGHKKRTVYLPATSTLTNVALFARDQHMCMYCGKTHSDKRLSRDHILPSSKGGQDTWLNCVTACIKCNHYKADRTPEQAGMKLLALPFEPNTAEYLILRNRHILADQMDFLKSFRRERLAS